MTYIDFPFVRIVLANVAAQHFIETATKRCAILLAAQDKDGAREDFEEFEKLWMFNTKAELDYLTREQQEE